METKKKYHFGLNVLLVVVFILFLSSFSSCYAFNPVSPATFAEYMSQNFGIDLTNYISAGFANNDVYLNFMNKFSASTGFMIVKNNNDFVRFTSNGFLYGGVGDILVFLTESDHPEFVFEANTSNFSSTGGTLTNKGTQYACYPQNTITDMYIFRSSTGKISTTSNKQTYTSEQIAIVSTLPSDVSTETFFSKIYSQEFLNEIVSSACNCTITIKSNQADNVWNYSSEVSNFKENPIIIGCSDDDPSTSGDSVDLTGIESGIADTNSKLDDLNNNLTAPANFDDKNISSDDLLNAVDVDFETDPYQNVWATLMLGLSNALTNSVRSINISFRGKTYLISLDNFSIQLPSVLKAFLTITSTVFLSWKMFKYIKIIIDNISSGNIDEVLQMNEEEGIVDLF